MNDYQFDAIYAEMNKQTELLTAISRANRWAAFSDEELVLMRPRNPGPGGNAGLRSIVRAHQVILSEYLAELARRKAVNETHP